MVCHPNSFKCITSISIFKLWLYHTYTKVHENTQTPKEIKELGGRDNIGRRKHQRNLHSQKKSNTTMKQQQEAIH